MDEPGRVTGRAPRSGNWIEINGAALAHNLRELQRTLGDTKLCMVVKGNAYGHGYGVMVPLAEAAGQRTFAVFSAREAAYFYQASDGNSRLLVTGHVAPPDVEWLLDRGAELWIHEATQWPVIREAVNGERHALVHLELETGMNRTGVAWDEAQAIAREVHEHPHVELVGVCTHLAGAEQAANAERVQRQKQRFLAWTRQLASEGIQWRERHLSSSAAALLDPEARLEMVRVGIACYGLYPSPHVREHCPDLDLRRLMAWKARVMTVKDVADGDQVGYGSSFEAEGDTRIAVVAVGYGDGFARDMSNRGHVLIAGRRASIVGPVNMSMVQVNVGHIQGVKPGDEVVLIGHDGEREISVASFADFSSMVNYELMARLSWEIPRRVVAHNA